MIQISFSEEDKEALNYERFHHPHPQVQSRIEALWLKSQGLLHNQITKLTGITGNTLRHYLKMYKEGGIEKKQNLVRESCSFWMHPILFSSPIWDSFGVLQGSLSKPLLAENDLMCSEH